jgi:signal transduction histidine kinase/CheY-like chemotaxis protein/HPt (histidine-containing phosphotransfer) domain-containing protein
MKTTKILYALCLVLISIFLVSLTWEFGLEDWIVPLFIDGFEPEPTYERWEYVISATLFAGLALVLPARLLFRMARRQRTLHAELEERVEHRTRQLRHQLDARKQMQAQLVEARDKAEVASAAKSLFLGNISHELRTPMSAVIGMSDVLGHTTLSAEQQHYVATIHNSGTAFLDIIDGLLDLSMIESGKFTPREGEFELHSVVEAMLDMLAYRACQRGLELLSLVDEDVPVCLRGDALALRQILLNLLGNALKFTEHGVVDLRVSVAARSPQQCRLRFAVRDTGPGIPAEHQAELFQPFTQGAALLPGHDGGTGLGLSICKSLVESMQGTMGVDSVPGEGSLFWCELDFAIGTAAGGATATSRLLAGRWGLVVDENPLARSTLQCQIEALGVRAEALAAPAVADVGARPLRVLVVEDQPVNQELMQLMLRRLGCEVALTGSAEEALELLRECAQDAVFMDCLMPGMDGCAAAAAIRRREPDDRHVVIIAMTALVVQDERERCLAAGMDDFLTKPVNEAILRNTLRRWFPGVDLGDEKSGSTAIADGDAGAAFRHMQAAGPEQIARLVDLFLDNTAGSLAAMRETLEQGDGHELAKMAHGLKGACLQLGMARMADVCGCLEDVGSGGDHDAAKLALAQLSEAFEQAGTELGALKNMQASAN